MSGPVPDRDRYIPLSKADLVDAIVARDHLSADAATGLGRLARWFSLLFHLGFFARREALKDRYTKFDPDHAAHVSLNTTAAERKAFFDDLEPALTAANFRRLTDAEVETDTAASGRVRARVLVPSESYEIVRFYGRGRRDRRYEVETWYGLRKEEVTEPVYDHVVFAAIATDAPVKGKSMLGRLKPGALYLKLFRDIPQGDLSTLYPNARVVMKHLDQVIIGVPALVGGIPILLNIVPTLTVLFIVLGAYLGVTGSVEEDSMKKALAAMSGLGALVGFMLRQWTKYERQKLRYQKQVLDNAYFNTVNNNRGFFDFVIGASEESEVKEALLAYAFLADHPEPLTEAQLDTEVEDWIRQITGVDVDFEVDDALRKLRELNLLQDVPGGLDVVDRATAEAECRAAWDKLAADVTQTTETADNSQH